jgi:hypothetical protein
VRITTILSILISSFSAGDLAVRPFSKEVYFLESWSVDFSIIVKMDEYGYYDEEYSSEYLGDLFDMLEMDMGVDVVSMTRLSCRSGFGGAFDILKHYENMEMRIRGEMFGVDFEGLLETPMYTESVDSIIRETLRDSVVVYRFSPHGEFQGGSFGGEVLTTNPANPWNNQDPFASGLFLLLEPQDAEPGNIWKVTVDTMMNIADFGDLQMRSDATYSVVGTEIYQDREVLRINYNNDFKSKPGRDNSQEFKIDDFSGSDKGYILYDVEFGLPVLVRTRFVFTGLFSGGEDYGFEVEVTADRRGEQVTD